jgi:ribonuclease P protein component
LPYRTNHLKKPAEFRLVYERGQRFDGKLMTVFAMQSRSDEHRFGVTASRKLAKNAVMRNRAKRLLREAFRLSQAELSQLQSKYDWVLNARRALLVTKVAAPLRELERIISQVQEAENRSTKMSS